VVSDYDQNGDQQLDLFEFAKLVEDLQAGDVDALKPKPPEVNVLIIYLCCVTFLL